MKIIEEISLKNFTPWGGAIPTFERLKCKNKLNLLEDILIELYPNGLSKSNLNDFLWMDYSNIYEMVGLPPEGEDEEED